MGKCSVCGDSDYGLGKWVSKPVSALDKHKGLHCPICYDKATREQKHREVVGAQLIYDIEQITNLQYIYQLLKKVRMEKKRRAEFLKTVRFESLNITPFLARVEKMHHKRIEILCAVRYFKT